MGVVWYLEHTKIDTKEHKSSHYIVHTVYVCTCRMHVWDKEPSHTTEDPEERLPTEIQREPKRKISTLF